MKEVERQEYSKLQILTEDKLHKIDVGIKYFPRRHMRSLAQTAEIAQSVLNFTAFS
jgi:hypothetical protein